MIDDNAIPFCFEPDGTLAKQLDLHEMRLVLPCQVCDFAYATPLRYTEFSSYTEIAIWCENCGTISIVSRARENHEIKYLFELQCNRNREQQEQVVEIADGIKVLNVSPGDLVIIQIKDAFREEPTLLKEAIEKVKERNDHLKDVAFLIWRDSLDITHIHAED